MRKARAMMTVVATILITSIVSAQTAPETFSNVTLNLQVGEKKKDIDATVRYEPEALVILDKKTNTPVKKFPYTGINAAEYSFSKSPRWKSAILVSPLFLLSSGKKHWFMVKSESDYAVMRLDKTNYKLILAAFETKAGKKVDVLKDEK